MNSISESQKLFLQSALQSGPPALEAWQTWSIQADFENLEPGLYSLLALFYQNLQSLGVTQAWMPRLKGAYRRTWYANQLIFNQLAGILDAFEKAGLKPLVCGKTALNLRFPDETGLLPIDQLELIVPCEQVLEATRMLEDLGWQVPYSRPRLEKLPYQAWISSINLKSQKGTRLSLGWHCLPYYPIRAVDEDFWNRALPLQVLYTSALAMDSASQFILACSVGIRPYPDGAACLADFALWLRCSPGFDWEWLVDLSTKMGLTPQLRAVLDTLQSVLQIPIPQQVSQRLGAMISSPADELEFQARITIEKERSWAQIFRLATSPYLKITHNLGQRARIYTFIEYLQYAWQLERAWQVPVVAGSKALRRLQSIKS